MPKFRKKPVVIEAFKWTGDQDQTEDPVWMIDALKAKHAFFINPLTEHVALVIKTLEGNMVAKRGDYIIQGVQGELYPCKPDIFAATYEPAE